MKYLDETEYNGVIRGFAESLKPLYDEGYHNEVKDLECRSRDGFSAASHNMGGFDVINHTYLSHMIGSGIYLNSELEARAEREYEEATEEFFRVNSHIPENLRDYNALCEAGREEEAEALDEAITEYLDEAPITYGYRLMYEGKDSSGWNTLMIYVEIEGSTVEEAKIRFRNVDELNTKLDRAKRALEAAL